MLSFKGFLEPTETKKNIVVFFIGQKWLLIFDTPKISFILILGLMFFGEILFLQKRNV